MDVVVIGAGLSGLVAAVCLREAGADVQLIEAGTRIGGRIQALRDPKTDSALADLGPTWVWPKYQPVVDHWLGALGLETFDQFNDGDAVIAGYGPAARRQPLPGQDGMVRIVGGPSAIIDRLARRLDPARLRVATAVTGLVEDGSKAVRIHLQTGETIDTQNVVLAIPLRVAATSLHMPWAHSDLTDLMRRTPTWMSTHAKAVALYDRPFWREAGLSGRIASRTGPLVEAHDHSGRDDDPAAIFGFVGWPPHLRQQDPEGLKQAILTQLTECLGPAARQPRQLVVQDWATNPHIVTDLDIAGPAQHPDIGPESLRQAQLDGRVRFTVSEVSQVSPGLIEGALAAGETAAAGFISNGSSG
ncbi:FAD-dependent oxidoreductase [Ponticoccus sp. SC2-23]|uniref:flavin monoamine oxidase family protein n=1 Tax=Alexandriicola marinus TaxID=2081710 RepID=UPI000FD87484|nr:FAD-dependent oxidoreductase [Alexandriicola marinus]MBM1218621.1 FAD-dependent oxidoreductase [Ponticoccus sp. SC6-9]MBM1224307.1 FAD-dependent oxidoreductase [Ponticoccus sp. SC6-15]MBM1229914.1 FAD-dependent oxidoreductase [Ponticoccus sp. SC6-38]MBM1233273.1 FAD-dependent oxidoreductase [Ponticoccus sp. SC6-45]MBM1236777.1 FAD-dependent oxidoreductase [Ponticoccus sp. SC6-49]MBM1242284.1 FAD-dependent oxidoreductase [Ponticoccus sp. SC2-64]MBM1246797.1 FAD-dependent oxidoreductase [Po